MRDTVKTEDYFRERYNKDASDLAERMSKYEEVISHPEKYDIESYKYHIFMEAAAKFYAGYSLGLGMNELLHEVDLIIRNLIDTIKEMDSGYDDMALISIWIYFFSLSFDYNDALIREANLNISDYIDNGIVTTAFAEEQNSVGNYQVNLHTGIDIVGGDLKSPFFMNAVGGNDVKSNEKISSINGTDLKMKVSHGDAGSVSKTGDYFKPGDKIMPFPKKNNFNLASTGHIFI